MKPSTRKAMIRFLFGTAVAAAGALLNAILWMHSKRVEASSFTKFWFVLFAVSILLGTLRFIWYQKHRDYFAEEMDHRRALTRGWTVARAKTAALRPDFIRRSFTLEQM